MIIDADAHVIECEDTWDFLEGSDKRFRPEALTSPEGRKLWLVDNRVMDRAVGDATIPDEIRELRDLAGRVKRMDELNIDVQVLYPTLFLGSPSDRTEIQVALTKSYNRWLGNIWSRGHGRFRWVLIPPLASPSEIMEELAFGKANGACGIFLRGIEGNKGLADSSFFPLYEKASELDLPICIHVGSGSPGMREVHFSDDSTARAPDIFFLANVPVLTAFHLLTIQGIPERFPRLRIGFIEAGAQWVPYMIGEVARRQARMGTLAGISDPRTTLAAKRYYVACRRDNDIPRLVESLGSDNLVMGTDYGHKDSASEIDAFEILRASRAVAPDIIDKILSDNARALYAL